MGLFVKITRRYSVASSFSLLVVRSYLGLILNAAVICLGRQSAASRGRFAETTSTPSVCGRSFTWLLVRVLAGFGCVILEYYAMGRLPLSTSSVILYSSPVFVVLWAAILLGQPLRIPDLVCMMACVAGMTLEVSPWESQDSGKASGYLAILASAVLAALVCVSLRALRDVPYYTVLNTFFLGSLSLSAVCGAAFHELHFPSWHDAAWVNWALVAVFAYAAEVCMTCGFARAGDRAGSVSVWKFLCPVFSMLWGALFLGEGVTWSSICGSTLILASSLTSLSLQARSVSHGQDICAAAGHNADRLDGLRR